MKPQIIITPWKALQNSLRECGDGGTCAAIISSSAEIPNSAWEGVDRCIFCEYQDIDYEAPGRSLSDEDAREIAEFVRAVQAETIFCCCDAGESRSPAVAAAICRYYELDDSFIWENPGYHPNMLVFEKLTNALGVPAMDGEMEELFRMNREAFGRAIRAARGEA